MQVLTVILISNNYYLYLKRYFEILIFQYILEVSCFKQGQLRIWDWDFVTLKYRKKLNIIHHIVDRVKHGQVGRATVRRKKQDPLAGPHLTVQLRKDVQGPDLRRTGRLQGKQLHHSFGHILRLLLVQYQYRIASKYSASQKHCSAQIIIKPDKSLKKGRNTFIRDKSDATLSN